MPWIVVGVVLTLVAQWCIGYRTTIDGDVGEGLSQGVSDARPGATYSLDIEQLCVEGSAPVTITAVRPVHASPGVAITDFALDAPTASRAPERRALTTYLDRSRFGVTGFGKIRRLENRCGSKTSDTLLARPLAVSVRLGDQLPAVIAGVEVDYRVRGITRTKTFTNGAGFCRGGETDADNQRMIEDLGELEDSIDPYTCSD